uniref:Terpene synthase n=1 Tax=Clitopilus sp. TaxID=1967123 RepID=A0A4P2VFW6_9AGAR|nr:putative sesquiterpene synthase [Clitopilus sp.]
MSNTFIVLPNLEETVYSAFPDHGLNPHYDAVCPHSRAWIKSYSDPIFGPKMRDFMEKCDFELFAAYICPRASPEALRTSMDITDAEDSVTVKKAEAIVVRTLQDRSFDDGSWICRLVKEFLDLHVRKKAGPNVSRRFVGHFVDYVVRVSDEATQRERHEVLDIEAYVERRRESGAIRLTFDLIESGLHIDLPQYVHEDPAFIAGYNATMDLACWVNDVYSYNMEQAKGHEASNILTVLMKYEHLDLQAAVEYVAKHCEVLAAQFIEAHANLLARSDPNFSEDAARVLDALGDAVIGNDRWSFETERYFGKDYKAVKQSRIVKLAGRAEGKHALRN